MEENRGQLGGGCIDLSLPPLFPFLAPELPQPPHHHHPAPHTGGLFEVGTVLRGSGV